MCDEKGTKEQEFDMLASQPLSSLRDAFWFVEDWMFDGPHRLKSAMFFIDGVCYADRRKPGALDYSTELIEWLKSTQPQLLRATASKSMALRLCDIGRLPFGERCIFRVGNEHCSVFGARNI